MRNRRLFHGLIRAASLMQKPVTRGERSIRHLPLFFSSLTEWRTLPAVAEKPLRDVILHQPQKVEKPRYRVSLFGGCANDFLYPELGLDLVTVMNAHDVEVYYPQKQNCCGVPALYSGDKETAIELRITSYNVCYTKLLRVFIAAGAIQFVAGAAVFCLARYPD